ncbi:putative secreted lipase [Podosphaera aphanis]|nr:putative secreted lipase [Podosphaera aphanis]
MLSFFLALGLVPCLLATPIDPPETNIKFGEAPSIDLGYATVIGSSKFGIDSYRGIPYAQPPVGDLRLRRPQPITNNIGVVNGAVPFPASCPQQYTSTNPEDRLPQDALQEIVNSGAVQRLFHISEDCLTISVQKPSDATPDSMYPVVFSLFFGGFGFGTTAIYDATRLIRAGIDSNKPIVYVAVNYRLGAFGWLGGKEIMEAGLPNLGHYDQILGLQWVQDNIRKFGGDPDKVTLFGTSAGSISTWNLLTAKDGALSYNGKPLFRGAIMDSGSIIPVDPVDSQKPQGIFDTVVKYGGCADAADKIDCLRKLDYDTFLYASTSVPGLFDYSSVALSYIPRPDGDLITASADDLGATGRFAKVPFIIGDQEDEGTLFCLVQRNITTTQDIIDYLKSYYFYHASEEQLTELVNIYPDDPTQGSPFNTGMRNNIYPQFKRLSALIGDITFTMIRRLVLGYSLDNHPEVPVYSFIASYGYGTPILGSFHVTDVLPAYGVTQGFPTRSVQNYYLNFVHSLNPNGDGSNTEFAHWPAWNENKEVINFRRDSNEIWKDDFRSATSDFLAKNRQSFHF